MNPNEELLNIAKEASQNSYSPYSKFPVGSAVMFESGNIYSGCNIENSSYGLALCAERNAISTAVASKETGRLIKISIYSPKSAGCFPCGACRQWIKEFAKGYNTEVILQNDDGTCLLYYINDLLPNSFELK